jgi:3-oxoacid CoA-transferase subunit B
MLNHAAWVTHDVEATADFYMRIMGMGLASVAMEHVAKDGSPTFVSACTLPLTGAQVVDMTVTELCVLSRPDRASPFRLSELAPGVTLEEVRARTSGAFLS